MVSNKVLFLGTGLMGAPMAKHVAAQGFEVLAWNRSPEKAEALKAENLVPVRTYDEHAASVGAVILMVSTGDVVDSLLFGGEGAPLADALASGALVIVMSSIPVEASRTQAARLAERGIGYIDAPVSGGERGAIKGDLTIMAGGTADDVKRARPVLETMGRVTHVGPAGSGQLSKLANQTIVGITIGAVAEALLLAEAGGADPAAVREALMGGFADSQILRQHGERMVTGEFTPGAHAHVQLKDVTTAQALGETLNIETPLLKLCRDLYGDLCETDLRDLDHSALYLHLKNAR